MQFLLDTFGQLFQLLCGATESFGGVTENGLGGCFDTLLQVFDTFCGLLFVLFGLWHESATYEFGSIFELLFRIGAFGFTEPVVQSFGQQGFGLVCFLHGLLHFVEQFAEPFGLFFQLLWCRVGLFVAAQSGRGIFDLLAHRFTNFLLLVLQFGGFALHFANGFVKSTGGALAELFLQFIELAFGAAAGRQGGRSVIFFGRPGGFA